MRVKMWQIIGIAFLLALDGCGKSSTSQTPAEITDNTICALDGMLLRDYPGHKAQIRYADGPPEFFCDTVEIFAMVLRPEQVRHIEAVYTQDMGRADWNDPRDNWIDAKSAYYVWGGRLKGSMGPTFAAFARREDAEKFSREQGGRVLQFSEVTPEMADLRGGAVRDEKM